MKKLYLLCIFFIFVVFTILFPLKTHSQGPSDFDGCWPDLPTALTYEWCEAGGNRDRVIRCKCGPGNCEASMQLFCSGPSGGEQ